MDADGADIRLVGPVRDIAGASPDRVRRIQRWESLQKLWPLPRDVSCRCDNMLESLIEFRRWIKIVKGAFLKGFLRLNCYYSNLIWRSRWAGSALSNVRCATDIAGVYHAPRDQLDREIERLDDAASLRRRHRLHRGDRQFCCTKSFPTPTIFLKLQSEGPFYDFWFVLVVLFGWWWGEVGSDDPERDNFGSK